MLADAAAVVHVGLLGVWAGAMGYSLLVAQPRAAAFFSDDEEHESFLVALAHGNRWRVVALLAAIAVSGVTWAVADDRLWGVQALRGLVLGAAAALFAYVSWRHWPARVFALPQERPAFRTRLRAVAWTMACLVGVLFASGLVLVATS
ncbi:hypothetical protein [Solicola sp. PLA-1-18]|uniref:hypothetical protein n=1 Tax=Solicola sp. PLA-1-18 TaxID=3380532 RepID=UPI003B7D8D0B